MLPAKPGCRKRRRKKIGQWCRGSKNRTMARHGLVCACLCHVELLFDGNGVLRRSCVVRCSSPYFLFFLLLLSLSPWITGQTSFSLMLESQARRPPLEIYRRTLIFVVLTPMRELGIYLRLLAEYPVARRSPATLIEVNVSSFFLLGPLLSMGNETQILPRVFKRVVSYWNYADSETITRIWSSEAYTPLCCAWRKRRFRSVASGPKPTYGILA